MGRVKAGACDDWSRAWAISSLSKGPLSFVFFSFRFAGTRKGIRGC